MAGRSQMRAARPRDDSHTFKARRDTWPMLEHSPLDLEHRLTVIEVTQDGLIETQDDHHERLSKIEASKVGPRDWLMIGAGILTVLGALAGRIDFAQAVALLVRN